MSGRGLPGGGLVRHHKPEDIKVTLNLRTTASSPTITLPNANPDASAVQDTYIQIHASVKSSTHPALAVTLSSWRTPLERSLSGDHTSSPVWLHSALTYLRSTSNPDRYGGPPELGYKVHRRGGFARNLREDWDFITIPSLESGQEVVVQHRLPVEKLQFWQKRDDGYRDSATPERGEKWTLGPSEGGLGTFWWRWGDLEGDLKGKRFRNDEWYDGEKGDGDGEAAEWLESEGENGFGLCMEIENQAEVTFV
ncbi:hypothetical protein MMC07_005817 [Pseudocyphellaria aurata]|nr:hypothetical protein [Pseudocyphellaria aurata]